MLLCTQDQWLTARSCQSVPSRWWPWAWSHPCHWRPWPDGGAGTGWGPLTWPPSAAQSWTAWSLLRPPVDYPEHKIQNNVILLGLWFYIALYRIGKMTSYCSSPRIDLYLSDLRFNYFIQMEKLLYKYKIQIECVESWKPSLYRSSLCLKKNSKLLYKSIQMHAEN